MHAGEAGVAKDPFGQVDDNYASVAPETVHGIYDAPNSRGIGGYDTFTTSTQPANITGEFGDLTSDKTILVLGDSHSMQWYGAIDIAARNLGYKVVSAGTWHAGGGLFELTYEFGDTWQHWQGNSLSVKRANERFNWIKDNLWADADVVIVGVSNVYHLNTKDTNPENTSQAPGQIATTFEELFMATGKKPILIQDNPWVSDFSDSIFEATDCKWEIDDLQTDALYNKLVELGKQNTFDYLVTKPLFSDSNNYAHSWIGGLPVYYDSNHINTLYSASAGEYFTEQLKGLGL